MRICAVDLKSNDANICLLDLEHGLFNIPDCRARKFTLLNPADTQEVRYFQKQFAKLMQDYRVDRIVIRERPTKGKFVGSSTSFKIEAALQLITEVETELLSSAEIKQRLKKNPPTASIKELGLKQFQEAAFETAIAYMHK